MPLSSTGPLKANRGVSAHVHAAGKALEGDDRETDKQSLSQLYKDFMNIATAVAHHKQTTISGTFPYLSLTNVKCPDFTMFSSFLDLQLDSMIFTLVVFLLCFFYIILLHYFYYCTFVLHSTFYALRTTMQCQSPSWFFHF